MDKKSYSAVISPHETSVCRLMFDVGFSHESVEEYTMPDYMPPIRRIIHCGAKVLPESKFISGNTMEVGGTIAYNVIYQDDEGNLCALPAAFSYTGNCVLPKIPEGADDVTMDARVDSAQCRAQGPRRVSLRSRLRTRLISLEDADIGEKLSDNEEKRLNAADELTLERKMQTVATMRRGCGSATVSVSGELHDTGEQVLCADGAVDIKECTVGDNTVTVRGDAVLWCLCKNGNESFMKTARLPFEEQLDCENAESGAKCRAFGRVASITVTPGEDGADTAECELDLECEWMSERAAQVTSDIYSSAYPIKSTFSDTDALSPSLCRNDTVTQSAAAAGRDAHDIIAVFADASCDSAEADGTKLVFRGKCRVCVIVAGDEIKNEEISVPIIYECETGGSDALWRCDMSPVNVRAQYEADRLNVTADVAVSVSAMAKNKTRSLETATLDKSHEYKADGAKIHVYYPEVGENMWDIAKRYHAVRRELYHANSVTGDNESPTGAVIITG